MTFAAAVALLIVASGMVIAGLAAALLELVLRNYNLSAVASLAAIAATPLVLIGFNLTHLTTGLVVSP